MLARLVLAAIACAACAVADLTSDIATQRTRSLQGVLDNLGPKGVLAPGANAGILVASPSTEDPNYYYTWTRDSALTFKMIVDEFIAGNDTPKTHIEDYIKAQAFLQTVSNPSGSLYTGRGLAEPKFYVNETAFMGSWGRPQRDGPALRATAMIAYMRWLLDNGGDDEATNDVWPVVRNDLDYVAQYWNQTGFDLWEEVSGSSFFTIAVQHRALVEGASMASDIGASCPGCESEAPDIMCFLQSFWNGEYAVANINSNDGRSGIDSNTVLTSIAIFDPAAKCDDSTFQPCSPKALANLKVYADSFRSIYGVNEGIDDSSAVATGRYAEDVYMGGNPWYLTTLSCAEQLYAAIAQYNAIGSISVTSVSLPFWSSILPDAAEGTFSSDSDTFKALINATQTFADGFVSIANSRIPEGGAMAEQFDRNTGSPLSARDLTWSYASYVTMAARRSAALHGDSTGLPASWGSSNANTVPETCEQGGVQGNYTSAVGETACYSTVTFNLNVTTVPGETMYLSGNVSELGDFSSAALVEGSAALYTSARPLWTFGVDLPADEGVAYKYAKRSNDGGLSFEDDERTYVVPGCGNPSVSVEDAWSG
ncbi:carbohydrate-binding module family 20 protein [Aulographum hederae CBS 113979]|uniref:Glucoamylase n=1 Tax=Aulographum hederae CBS 113979 TaxID=1176131 RepID=A0A6G1H7M9_9PEZI|nr:carbohydrate-binding module family 20 protein [Aulographum hederae CBS 113979]